MNTRPMTLTQKILAHHARRLERPWVQAGDVLQLRVDWTMASELAWNGMDRTYQALGRPELHDRERVFLAVDHTVDAVTLAKDVRVQRLVQRSRDFARERRLRHFYDANETILHTKFYRELVQPGQLVLGADSHTTSHGGLGAFAIGLGGADIVAAMVLGETWLEVPEAIAVEYQGTPAFGIGGKDIILKTLGLLGRNTAALERTVEYRGEAARGFTTDMRFTIANMTAELGGLNGIFEPDARVAEWLAIRPSNKDEALYFRADEDAPYVQRFSIALEKLGPQLARPYSPDNVLEVQDAAGMAVDGCFIGACTTTEEELVLAALLLEQALRGKAARPASPKRLVVPGDLAIHERMRQASLWRHYERAGFRIGPPGCSMCLGVASEKALPGEVWLTSQNRNYENRMGPGSHAWLASAATVAASSLKMRVEDPRAALERIDPSVLERILARKPAGRPIEFPSSEPRLPVTPHPHDGGTRAGTDSGGRFSGRIQRFGDHVDTDAIIPGEFCHLDEPSELARHAFRYVRPDFLERVQQGRTLIVAGEGWGTGSSREQAVWALAGAGIQAIIASSYAFIHRRNLVNEALPHLVVTSPAFHALVQEDEELVVDLETGLVEHVASGQWFQAERPSPIARALMQEGGLVPAIRRLGARALHLGAP
ncbi:3-isopropylmalate dehydratase [Myxococcus xanthus]|uniref:LeuD/DmdB family oxidoreductase small subunit n=1 Tax=Myxococcus xanthus TaxID=34 RepID=UPI001129C9D9|nr:aconitase family protein [Myxococcus xanthus]QDE88559.1 3-isopropylmalate dehydratase [Myxococcus xanthus]